MKESYPLQLLNQMLLRTLFAHNAMRAMRCVFTMRCVRALREISNFLLRITPTFKCSQETINYNIILVL